MTKYEFLSALERQLSILNDNEREKAINFYDEAIDDRMEDGYTEAEAVAAMGSPEACAKQVIAEIPITTLVKQCVKPKRGWTALNIILLILGSPIWLSIALALFGVVLSVYIVIWTLVVVLWCCTVAFACSGITCVIAAPLPMVMAYISGITSMPIFGGGLVCIGVAILFFFASLYTTIGVGKLSRGIFRWIKSLFIKEAK